MDSIAFRAATEADIPAVIKLVTSAYRGPESRQGWTTEADILDGPRIHPDILAADISRPRSMVLLGERDGDGLLACAHIAAEDDACYFGMFAVRPAQQGGGAGKAILAEAERIAREQWGLGCMRMAVIDLRESLIAFYLRRGYARTGIHRPFPYGDERFGIPLRADLRLELLEKPLHTEPTA